MCMDSKETLETIKKAAAGNRAARAELWNEYQNYIYKCARSRKAAAELAGYGYTVDVEDLAHGAYLDMVKAAETFDPAKSQNFKSWLLYYLKKSFNDTLEVRTKRGRLDPIKAAGSVDMILPGQEDILLCDIIADPADPFAEIIESDYQQSIYNMIRDAIGTIEAPELEKNILTYMVDNGFNVEIFEAYRAAGGHVTGRTEYDKNHARTIYKQGIKKLRRELLKTKRKALYKDYYFPAAYRAPSFSAWQRSGCSVVEICVLKRAELLDKLNR